MASLLVSAYASVIMIQSMANNLLPLPVQSFLDSTFRYLFSYFSTEITFVIEEASGLAQNHVFEAAETYLRTRISTQQSIRRFKVDKTIRQKRLTISIDKNEEIFDTYQNQMFKWKLLESREDERGYLPHLALIGHGRNRYFELSFNKKLKEIVVDEYLPFILEKFKEIQSEDKVVKLYTRKIGGMGCMDGNVGNKFWSSINLEHPATFETLAMQPETKTALLEDLDRFVSRKKFYKQVGKAWKRGYLLYGPPGTGKSSLIAAMANHLKFDIYDLELTSLYSNSELRTILLSTTNRSILVIEDIDCSLDMQDSANGPFTGLVAAYQQEASTAKLTLSGLLNFIDGLWSSCGDERIIVFTTNQKDKLDPALLRPGRMDMHIHMSYCTKLGFRQLAYNYLGIHVDQTNYNQQLFGAIDDLIENVEVTPAELAEELMRSEDADIALEGVVDFLKLKRLA